MPHLAEQARRMLGHERAPHRGAVRRANNGGGMVARHLHTVAHACR
jgi:hypothetical protein